MNFGPINLQSEVQELAERIDTRDERADIAMKISDLTLEQEKTKLELEKIRLEQEKERLNRLQKNSGRRPLFFWSLMIVIGLLYGSFFIMVWHALFANPTTDILTDAEARLYIIQLILLGVIPTVLVALVMKAIFSATAKNDEKSTEIKIADAVPIKVITESLTRQ